MDRLERVGRVAAVRSDAVGASRIGIGFEKLDRNVFDPEKAYDKVAALGVKWVRIQSGWARTEVEKGVYDFAWLDAIVDNLLRRGLQPWMCLCYGNGLYNEQAAKVFGAVGCPPIFTQEEREAWSRYVTALTARYKGRIGWYEVWNEPDGKWCWKHGPSGTEYGEFVIRTAEAARKGDAEAKIIGGSICLNGLQWLNDVLRTGAGAHMDALTYHSYTHVESDGFDRVQALRALCHSYRPDMKIIQGETGTQSRSDGAGALAGAAWTEARQAKFMARHMVADMMDDVMFASYFSCMDMVEALNGTVDDKASRLDYGYFGVLRAEFDSEGFSTGEYTCKPSYRTLQTVASIFRGTFEPADLPVQFTPRHSPRLLRGEDARAQLTWCGFRRPDGSACFAYWNPTDLLTTSYESTMSFEIAGLPEPMLVDLLDGTMYRIPAKLLEGDGQGFLRLNNLPLRDYPLLLVFGDFLAPKNGE